MSKILIYIAILLLFFLNFVYSMDDEFGQHYGEVRESIDGINIYHQYGGFGYPQQGYSPKLDFNHQPKHYYENPPPTPRFSNYEESVGSNDNGCEFSASVSEYFYDSTTKCHE